MNIPDLEGVLFCIADYKTNTLIPLNESKVSEKYHLNQYVAFPIQELLKYDLKYDKVMLNGNL